MHPCAEENFCSVLSHLENQAFARFKIPCQSQILLLKACIYAHESALTACKSQGLACNDELLGQEIFMRFGNLSDMAQEYTFFDDRDAESKIHEIPHLKAKSLRLVDGPPSRVLGSTSRGLKADTCSWREHDNTLKTGEGYAADAMRAELEGKGIDVSTEALLAFRLQHARGQVSTSAKGG